MDILRDYLKKDFSEDEINDIIRDYEEYFVDGQIEGKSDLDIISALGSPKAIAIDLISQIKYKENNDKKNKIKDIYNKGIKNAKYLFLDLKNFIDGKLTPRLDEQSSKSSKEIRFILFLLSLLSLLLIIPAFFVVCFMALVAGFLAVSLISFLVAIPLMVSFSWDQL
ncbi:DUF1700 domain-containing protein [Terrisporobacter sp.]